MPYRSGGAMTVVAAPAESPVGRARRKPYRVTELAELWDLDTSTIYRMIYSGRLRAERHGPRGGALRIPVDAVAEYVRQVTTSSSGLGLAFGADAGFVSEVV